MNSEKLIGLLKQFRKLESEQKDLDYRRAQWAREARGCFQDDRRFIVWCKSDLGLTEAQSQDLCLLARAAGVVTDPKTWINLGGSRQIRAVEQLATKREQVTVLEAAKATGKAIRTLVRERLPIAETAKPEFRPADKRKMIDAEVLAQFIVANISRLPKLPSDVAEIVRMYAPGTFLKAA